MLRRRGRTDDGVVEAGCRLDLWLMLPAFGLLTLLLYLLLPPHLAGPLTGCAAFGTVLITLFVVLFEGIISEEGSLWRLGEDSLEVRGRFGLLRTVPRAELGEVRTEGQEYVIETSGRPVRIPRFAARADHLVSCLRTAAHGPAEDDITPEQINTWLGLDPDDALSAQRSFDNAIEPVLETVAVLLVPVAIFAANLGWYGAAPKAFLFGSLCLIVLLTLRVIWRRAAPLVINGHGIFQGTRQLAGWDEVESLGGRYDGAFRVGSRWITLTVEQGVAVAEVLARLAPAVAEGRLTAPVGDVPDQALSLAEAPAAPAERGLSRVDPGDQGVSQ